MGCGSSLNQVHAVDDNVISKLVTQNHKKHDRGDSATSQTSRRSGDSGFDDEEEIQRHRESALLGLFLACFHRNF